jgi:hypothetical protein
MNLLKTRLTSLIARKLPVKPARRHLRSQSGEKDGERGHAPAMPCTQPKVKA